MKPFVKANKGGGWIAFGSIWAYLFGRPYILRSSTWAAMQAALGGREREESHNQNEGLARRATS